MRIRLLRVGRDITLTDFAERIGVGVDYLSRIERQHIGANVGILRKISKEFGLPVDDLLRDDTGAAKAA